MSKGLIVGIAGLVAAMALGSAALAAPQSSQGMYGITITNYKVNGNGTVTLNVNIRGLKMGAMSKKNVAGKGHWNIYVNGKLNNYSANPTRGTTKALRKGDYKVYATLVNNNGTPLSEPTRSKSIPVMVDA